MTPEEIADFFEKKDPEFFVHTGPESGLSCPVCASQRQCAETVQEVIQWAEDNNIAPEVALVQLAGSVLLEIIERRNIPLLGGLNQSVHAAMELGAIPKFDIGYPSSTNETVHQMTVEIHLKIQECPVLVEPAKGLSRP
ncbi:MAG: hypothetical protein ACU0CA_07545 [Paracoccaceae bacterium]